MNHLRREKALRSEKKFGLFDRLKLGRVTGASWVRREVAEDEAEEVAGSQVVWGLSG